MSRINQEEYYCHYWEDEGLLSEDDESMVTEPSIKVVYHEWMMLVDEGDMVVAAVLTQTLSSFYKRRTFRCTPRSRFPEFGGVVRALADDERRVIPFMFCVHMYMRVEDLEEDRAVLEESLEVCSRTVAAAKEAVEGLKSVAVGAEGAADLCVICMEEMGTVAKEMPCEHCFHEDCIVQWLNMSHVCPLCRFPLPTSGDLAIESFM